MTAPNELSMVTLLAEDGMSVTAGLPEELRRDLERLNAARKRLERVKEKRERLERLLASIAEHEARIEELQKELEEAMREYAEATIGAPAA